MASAIEYLHDHYGDCKTLAISAGSDLTGGDPVSQGSRVGIVKYDVSSGETVPIIVETGSNGIAVPKKSNSWSVGDAIYYDSANDNFSNSSGDGNLAGYATQSAAAGDSRGRVALTNESG